jgi:ADP-heptose:LPS heptosyltransferase
MIKTKPDEHILVIQLAKLGDYLQTTPLLSALKAQKPSRRLTVLCAPNQVDPASRTPGVDDVIPIDLAGLAQMAKRKNLRLSDRLSSLRDACEPLAGLRFHRTINLNTSRISALLSEMVQTPRRDGPTLAGDRRSLTRPAWADFIMQVMTRRRLNRFNLVDLYLTYADVVPAAPQMTYTLNRADREAAQRMLGEGRARRLVGFQLGSRHQDRQWPVKQFAELGRRLLQDRDMELVLTGADVETPLGNEFLDHLADETGKLSRVRNLIGKTTLPELAGVLANLDLLVTTDTGTMHLASAMETPILALFMGPALVHETGPYGAGHTVIQVNTPCSPCTEGKSQCPAVLCRDILEPGSVAAVAESILQGRPGRFGPENARKFNNEDCNIQVWTSEMDDFGVAYHPLTPWPLDRETISALALRERGRRIMRPGYRTDRQRLANELSKYLCPVDDVSDALSALEKIADPAVRGMIPQKPVPSMNAAVM